MEQFDITEFARMFDAALASDNPAVQKALRNFMMVAAIVHAEDNDNRVRGPFETLIKRVDTLESMVRELQNNRTYKDQYKDLKDKYYKDYYNNPTWVAQPYTTSVSTTGGTAQKSIYNNGTDFVEVDDAEIYKLLKENKI